MPETQAQSSPSDKLRLLLDRARARAAQSTEAKARSKHASAVISAAQKAEALASDYAQRLAERSKFRRLLSDDSLDGVRFRWLYAHLDTPQSLDEFRRFIDGRIRK